MLIQKLLRLEDNLIKEIEELATKLSEKKYTSFSALTRQLLRMGVDTMNTNEQQITNDEQAINQTCPSFASRMKQKTNEINKGGKWDDFFLSQIAEKIENEAAKGSSSIYIGLEEISKLFENMYKNQNNINWNYILIGFTAFLFNCSQHLVKEGFEVQIQGFYSFDGQLKDSKGGDMLGLKISW